MRCPPNTPALLALGALLLAGCSVQSPGRQESPVLAAPEAAPAPAPMLAPAPPPPPDFLANLGYDPSVFHRF